MTTVGTAPGPEIRLATVGDLPPIRRILAAHGNDGPIVIADVVGPYVRHLIGRGGAWVAVSGDEPVAFGAAVDTGRGLHLADLFVSPDRLGQGIGKALLEVVLAGSPHRTTFASEDPRALPLYVRAGMTPLWASLYVQGPSAALPPTPPALQVDDPASSDELVALETSWTGVDRDADHAYWSGMPDGDAFVIRDGDAVAAFGYARARQAARIRVLDRLLIHRDADPVATTIAALRRAGRAGPVLACMLGPHPALRPLLDSGFRIVDRDLFLATDPDLADPTRLVPNPGML